MLALIYCRRPRRSATGPTAALCADALPCYLGQYDDNDDDDADDAESVGEQIIHTMHVDNSLGRHASDDVACNAQVFPSVTLCHVIDPQFS